MPTGFIGSGESGKSFGRFRYMFNDELSSRTQISETDKSDALIDVELSEYPMHKRNCNVMHIIKESHITLSVVINEI